MIILEQSFKSLEVNETTGTVSAVVASKLLIEDAGGNFEATRNTRATALLLNPMRRSKRRLLKKAAQEAIEFFDGEPGNNDRSNAFDTDISDKSSSSLSFEDEISLRQELAEIEREFENAA